MRPAAKAAARRYKALVSLELSQWCEAQMLRSWLKTGAREVEVLVRIDRVEKRGLMLKW